MADKGKIVVKSFCFSIIFNMKYHEKMNISFHNSDFSHENYHKFIVDFESCVFGLNNLIIIFAIA